jgi:Leucine-rich repeat (LRR) protein
MSVIITESNIDDFSRGTFNDIIEMEWIVDEFNESIIKKFPNLQKLNCYYNKIRSLKPLANCVNLQKLNCYYNKIRSLKPLANCINLQRLNCSNNYIISLDPLAKYINLQYLGCSNNQIKSLDSLAHCFNLVEISCDNNQIKSLDPLANCFNLQILYCHNNQITSLDALANCYNLGNLYCWNNSITSIKSLIHCINLQKLYCQNNYIKSLDPLANCTNLQVLDCYNNQIESLECLVYLRRLRLLNYSNNPLTIQSIQVQRFINHFINPDKKNNIYQDKQNVHDVTIQKTVCDSLQSLLKDEKPLFSINDIIASNLNLITKESLIEYCQNDSVHSVHLITYTELLGFVWQRIIKSVYKEELFKILEEQIAESECKCFTGRFNRTLSVLVGFYDDIKINISDNARIGAIIITCKEKITPYNSHDHKNMVEKELLEAGYTNEEIKPWVDAIGDE